LNAKEIGFPFIENNLFGLKCVNNLYVKQLAQPGGNAIAVLHQHEE
jgi:hypothetical protein